jgi:hypothetical protein
MLIVALSKRPLRRAGTAKKLKECVLSFFLSGWLVKPRVFAGMLLLTGAALVSSYRLLQLTPSLSSRQPDEVSAYEARFAPAWQFLPKHGVVCYLPDWTSSETAKKDFFLARYALAPLVVRTVPDCDPLIADFPPGLPPSFLGNRYAVLEDFGRGVLLLKRNER